ncbi:rhombosortase [Ampullimonas aquatilis]|uniref:rhombosortase n=1 Tax=Ampullimonas aquatilis TaxID=1341549 RepID=UPI003C7887FC
MKNQNMTAHRQPDWLAVVLAWSCIAALVITYQAIPGLADWGRFRRNTFLQGAWWQLMTAPWIHLSWAHAVLNLIMTALLMTLFAKQVRPWQQLLIVMLCGIALLPMLAYAFPEVQWYVGLSGSLHGLATYGALTLLGSGQPFVHKRTRLSENDVGVIAMLWIGIKLALEHAWSTPIIWRHNMPIATAAHLTGALAGLCFWFIRLGTTYVYKLSTSKNTLLDQ